jgi:hypothetical protein
MIPVSNQVVDVMKYSDWVTLGLGIAAFIGSIWSNIIAYGAVKSTGRQLIADYHKEWIESLRKDVADLLAQDTILLNCDKQIDDLNAATKSAADTELVKKLQNETIEVIKLQQKAKAARLSSYSSILLKLNDEEAENGELIVSVKSVLVATNLAESSSARSIVIDKARTLFKKEWMKLNTELKT